MAKENNKKYGEYDGDLQMFKQKPFVVGLVYGQQEGVKGDVIVGFEKAESTDEQFDRFVHGLEFLKRRAEKGEVGPKSMEEDTITIKGEAVEQPKPGPSKPGVQTYGEWGLGPMHPDYPSD